MSAHCGRCDLNRHVELPDGRVARCPTCHPLRREIRAAHCAEHPGQPIAACALCAGEILGQSEESPRRPQLRLIQGGQAA